MDSQEEEIYGGFARVYDIFMDEVPYDEWYEYLSRLLRREGVSDGTVLDLACGTGEITRRLFRSGYHVIGVDVSQEMLAVAGGKCPPDVVLLHQDMRELELLGKVQGAVCLCDGMNYLLSERDLAEVFARTASALEGNGVFIFDMKTSFYYREILGDSTFADNREDVSYIWDNEYDRETGINTYLLSVYELVDDERDLFVRTDELHRQRAYPPGRVKELLQRSGFSAIEVYEAMTEHAPTEKSERVYFVCRRENGE